MCSMRCLLGGRQSRSSSATYGMVAPGRVYRSTSTKPRASAKASPSSFEAEHDGCHRSVVGPATGPFEAALVEPGSDPTAAVRRQHPGDHHRARLLGGPAHGGVADGGVAGVRQLESVPRRPFAHLVQRERVRRDDLVVDALPVQE